MRLFVLGLDNAGNTTIIKKYNGEDIDKISLLLVLGLKELMKQ